MEGQKSGRERAKYNREAAEGRDYPKDKRHRRRFEVGGALQFYRRIKTPHNMTPLTTKYSILHTPSKPPSLLQLLRTIHGAPALAESGDALHGPLGGSTLRRVFASLVDAFVLCCILVVCLFPAWILCQRCRQSRSE